MAECQNQVTYHVQRGYDYRAVQVRCGLTDPHGGRAVCDECSSDRRKMGEIERDEANIEADNQWAKSAGWGEF